VSILLDAEPVEIGITVFELTGKGKGTKPIFDAETQRRREKHFAEKSFEEYGVVPGLGLYTAGPGVRERGDSGDKRHFGYWERA
jgi:hypothetical protein